MQTVIVVGNGMVGYKFCEKFAAKCRSKDFKIIVFGEEPRPAYDRVHLSEFFENQDAKALEMATKMGFDLLYIYIYRKLRNKSLIVRRRLFQY